MPTPHLRRFAAELSQLHTAAKIGADQLKQQTGVSPATLHRVLTARTCPQRRTVVALLDTYGTGELRRNAIFALHAKAMMEQAELRNYPPDLPAQYVTYMTYEAAARQLLNFEAQFVPGLLQTPEYTRATIQGVRPTISPPTLHRRVEARVKRQARLTGDHPLQLAVIMDEAALWREVGGPLVMCAQLRHLREAAAQPNITLQVVPYSAGAHPGMIGTFAVLRFPDPDDPDVAYIDSSMETPFFLDGDADLLRYSATFADLQRVALTPDDSLALIATATIKFAHKEENA
ncbi:MAG: helix-turn-helix domain-containing protein [Actinobacteria bacterium]|nr:helix-turn-helix domain-containing protein [Actinomycetota bacterium]